MFVTCQYFQLGQAYCLTVCLLLASVGLLAIFPEKAETDFNETFRIAPRWKRTILKHLGMFHVTS